ncbi:MAG: hypothetical protein M5U28_03355 [Sandaracinaceae bacterium]|nr:hypothetical protein [Sandaracinaceae bacterium]
MAITAQDDRRAGELTLAPAGNRSAGTRTRSARAVRVEAPPGRAVPAGSQPCVIVLTTDGGRARAEARKEVFATVTEVVRVDADEDGARLDDLAGSPTAPVGEPATIATSSPTMTLRVVVPRVHRRIHCRSRRPR